MGVGVAEGASAGVSPADRADVSASVPGAGSLSGSEAEPLAEGFGVAASSLPDASSFSSFAVADGDGVAFGDSDSLGSSDRVTHGPGANGMSARSSARASLGVSPMPTKTAVGIAASASAFLPLGRWSLVSSDFLGAAWRGPLRSRRSSPG